MRTWGRTLGACKIVDVSWSPPRRVGAIGLPYHEGSARAPLGLRSRDAPQGSRSRFFPDRPADWKPPGPSAIELATFMMFRCELAANSVRGVYRARCYSRAARPSWLSSASTSTPPGSGCGRHCSGGARPLANGGRSGSNAPTLHRGSANCAVCFRIAHAGQSRRAVRPPSLNT